MACMPQADFSFLTKRGSCARCNSHCHPYSFSVITCQCTASQLAQSVVDRRHEEFSRVMADGAALQRSSGAHSYTCISNSSTRKAPEAKAKFIPSCYWGSRKADTNSSACTADSRLDISLQSQCKVLNPTSWLHLRKIIGSKWRTPLLESMTMRGLSSVSKHLRRSHSWYVCSAAGEGCWKYMD